MKYALLVSQFVNEETEAETESLGNMIGKPPRVHVLVIQSNTAVDGIV